MGGDVTARLNLGFHEFKAGNFDRAIKLWMIAASFGDSRAVNHIKNYATKDHYAQALRYYKQYLDEVRSDQKGQSRSTFR